MELHELLSYLAGAVSLLLPFLAWIGWSLRKWIREQVPAKDEVIPHLTNDGTSCAVYAHNAATDAKLARDAANDAKEAALDAKEAVLEVKELILKQYGIGR